MSSRNSFEKQGTFCGKEVGLPEISWVNRLVRSNPFLSRLEIARAACKRFDWRRPNGRFPERTCLAMLEQLEQSGAIRLPTAKRSSVQKKKAESKAAEAVVEAEPIVLPCLRRGADLVVRPLAREEYGMWQAHLERFHYLGCPVLVGESLRYGAWLDGALVALSGFAAASLKNAARDAYIGWNERVKKRHLPFVVNNVRFLIPPHVRVPNLASRVLSLILKRLSGDWERRYDHPVLLAETFVDESRFRGACYRAAGWIHVGQTKGYARKGGGSNYVWEHHGNRKAVLVHPLSRDAVRLLRSSFIHAKSPGEKAMLDTSDLKLEGEDGLFHLLSTITDPRMRRGKRFQLESVLAVAVCAVLCGARSFAAIAQWGQDQSEQTLRRLQCRRGMPPSEPTIRRVLKSIDAEEADEKICGWLAVRQGFQGKGVAIDGKTLRGSREGESKGVHLLSAVVHGTGVVVAQTRVDCKTNEITRVEPLFEGLDIEGATVTADALLTQTKIARHLTEDKKADYVLTVKDNQPTLRQDIDDFFEFQREEAERMKKARDLDDEAFPP